MRSLGLVTAVLLAGASGAGGQSTGGATASAGEGLGGQEPGFVGRTARDLGRGVADLASDGWRVLTVPTRMDGGDVGVLAGVLGVGGLLYVWDEGLHGALRRQDGNALHDALIDVGDWAEPVGLMGNTNRWYALGVVVGYLSGWDPLLHASRDLLASHWLAAGTYNPPRDWIGRSRPEEVLDARAFEGGTSLPSGHASSIVQVAAVLSHHIRWTPARVALWGVAGTVLLQRVDSDKHWPSDVWIGAAWGYGVSRLVLARADERRSGAGDGRATGEEPRVRIGPWMDPVSGGPGVVVRIGLGGG